ncbi:MAG TPA: branched-chain amino acid ABC transporter permease [Chloroflexota bacterium]|nr:branched-chain amino acid ABC transporter permease [Chloroflexota bacterium]
MGVTRYKLYAIAISAALTAMGGTFYAQYILVIDPESVLPLSLSVLICLVAVLGGVGTIWGPLLGAVVLIPLSEGTRVYLAGSAGGGRAVDLMVYGALIVLVAVFQPGGLMALLGDRGRGSGASALRGAGGQGPRDKGTAPDPLTPGPPSGAS